VPETLHEYGDASENALVELARDNDYRAYEQLYQQHAGRVYALCGGCVTTAIWLRT
jgi:hypothetical protein